MKVMTRAALLFEGLSRLYAGKFAAWVLLCCVILISPVFLPIKPGLVSPVWAQSEIPDPSAESAAQKPRADESPTESPTKAEPPADKFPTEEPPADEDAPEKVSTEEPPTTETTTETSSEAKVPTPEPSIEDVTAPEQPAKESSTDRPPAEESQMEEVPPDKAPAEEPPEEEDTVVDETHERLSKAFLASANWLDSFFDDETARAEDNRSRLRLRFDAFVEEGEEPSYKVRVSLRLTLPRTNNKLQLIAAGNESDVEEDVDSDTVSRAQARDDDEDDFAIGLRYFFVQTKKNNVSLTPGIRIRSSSVAGFIGPRWRVLVPLNSWSFRSVQRLRWFTDDGWEWLSRFDFERRVLKKLLFRSRSQVEWFEDEDGFFPEQRFSLFHPLDTRRALKYEWINRFVTDPKFELDDLILRIRYRQRIWRDWFFFEIGPDASFPEDRDYEFTPGFLFRIETIIGKYRRLPKPPKPYK
jgi:chemotaxis protein histidine kinase CheA